MEALAKVLQDTELGAATYVDKGVDVDGLHEVGLRVRDVEIGTGKGDSILSASQSAAVNMLKQLEADAPALAMPEEDATAPPAPTADPLPAPAADLLPPPSPEADPLPPPPAADLLPPPPAVEPLASELKQETEQAGDDYDSRAALGSAPSEAMHGAVKQELAAELAAELGEQAPAAPCVEEAAAAAAPHAKPSVPTPSKKPKTDKASRELSNLFAAFDAGSLVGTTAMERPAITAAKLRAEAMVAAAATSKPQVPAAKRGPVRAAVHAQGAAVLLRLTVGAQSRAELWQQTSKADGKLKEGARPEVGRDVWEVDRLVEKRRGKGRVPRQVEGVGGYVQLLGAEQEHHGRGDGEQARGGDRIESWDRISQWCGARGSIRDGSARGGACRGATSLPRLPSCPAVPEERSVRQGGRACRPVQAVPARACYCRGAAACRRRCCCCCCHCCRRGV